MSQNRPLLALAAMPASAVSPVPPVAGMMQMFFGLLLVLAVLLAAAWLLKRYTFQQKIPGGEIRVIAGAAVGQRERVVLVEIGETWLVVGVAPGQVNALCTLPRREIPARAPDLADGKFPAWLRQFMEKRNAGV